jgi:SAM-dependent methyltransferase/uncharacterized protein YbaR (Trm112 family)
VRRRHFETLRPLCPVCWYERQAEAPLRLASVTREDRDVVFEGILHCPDAACQREYPILDGLPILVANLRSYIADQLSHLLARADLSADLETLLGDCCGPGSAYDQTRQHLSSYTWDHYGDLDPEEPASGQPGGVMRLLHELLPHLSAPSGKPILEPGCSVGRGSFVLADHAKTLVLGMDLNISMLRLAARVLYHGSVRYPRRRVGLVYDRREFATDLLARDLVDFWVCDALAPPFVPATFGGAVALNLLDCVTSPWQFLQRTAALVTPGGFLALTTPYDWSAAVPVETWLGGHSQRGPHHGSSEPILRALLTPGAYPQSLNGFRIIVDLDRLPWPVRLHERSIMEYQVHAVVAQRETG